MEKQNVLKLSCERKKQYSQHYFVAMWDKLKNVKKLPRDKFENFINLPCGHLGGKSELAMYLVQKFAMLAKKSWQNSSARSW